METYEISAAARKKYCAATTIFSLITIIFTFSYSFPLSNFLVNEKYFGQQCITMYVYFNFMHRGQILCGISTL